MGTQAVLNILSGERYKIIPNEIKNYVKGLYGRSPVKIDPNFSKMILGDEKPITHRPADDIEPMLPGATENLDSSLIEHEEDIISYCLFPEQALEYFKWRTLPPEDRSPSPAELELAEREKTRESVSKIPSSEISDVSSGEDEKKLFLSSGDYDGFTDIMQKMYELNISELVIRKGEASIALKSETVSGSRSEPVSSTVYESETVKESDEKTSRTASVDNKASSGKESADEATALTINSPLVGKFYTTPSPGKPSYVAAGCTVKSGDTVCIVEAMKLINEINAPVDCKIVKFLAEDGDNVEKGQPLIVIEKL